MAEKLVHIVPIEGVYIMGVPAIEQDVTEEEAERLLGYDPPAFTLPDPPAKPPKPARPAGFPIQKER